MRGSVAVTFIPRLVGVSTSWHSKQGMVRGDQLIGATIAQKYEVRTLLGQGGMGSVYEAWEVAPASRAVALKTLNADLRDQAEVRERFLREAAVIGRLTSKHVIRLYTAGYDQGHDILYLVSELLRGQTLEAALRKGVIEPLRTIRILRGIALGLADAHDHGVVHRDVKPDNVFLQRDREGELVRLLDFGIASIAELPGMTKPGQVYGTAHYLAPEQACGFRVDHRADIYALGALAYRCLAGRPPFVGQHLASIMHQHVRVPPRPFSALEPPVTVDQDLERLVLQCLEKEADDRPSSMDEVLSVLKPLGDYLEAGDDRYLGGVADTLPRGAVTALSTPIPPAGRPGERGPRVGPDRGGSDGGSDSPPATGWGPRTGSCHRRVSTRGLDYGLWRAQAGWPIRCGRAGGVGPDRLHCGAVAPAAPDCGAGGRGGARTNRRYERSRSAGPGGATRWGGSGRRIYRCASAGSQPTPTQARPNGTKICFQEASH